MGRLSEEQQPEPTIRTGGEGLSIFEIMQRYRNDGSCEYVIQDALRRLSLLDSDSQAVETFAGPCVSCGHNNYDAERKECKQRWMEGRMSVVCGCPCAKHNSFDAAVAAALTRLLTDIESLTLDQVKPEKP